MLFLGKRYRQRLLLPPCGPGNSRFTWTHSDNPKFLQLALNAFPETFVNLIRALVSVTRAGKPSRRLLDPIHYLPEFFSARVTETSARIKLTNVSGNAFKAS